MALLWKVDPNTLTADGAGRISEITVAPGVVLTNPYEPTTLGLITHPSGLKVLALDADRDLVVETGAPAVPDQGYLSMVFAVPMGTLWPWYTGGATGINYGWSLQLSGDASNGDAVVVSMGGGTVVGLANPRDNQWHNIIFAWDRSANTREIFYDGASISQRLDAFDVTLDPGFTLYAQTVSDNVKALRPSWLAMMSMSDGPVDVPAQSAALLAQYGSMPTPPVAPPALTWAEPATGGSPITGYKVRYFSSSAQTISESTVLPALREWLIPAGYSPSDIIQVVAVNSLGESTPAEYV